MIEGSKSYPAMKDSGVPWLGAVPKHWEVKRIKHIADVNPSRRALTKDTSELATFLPMERVSADGRIDPHEQRPIAQLVGSFTSFRRNDVIIAKITPCFENGKGACLDQLPTELGFGSTEFVVLRATPLVLPQFLYRQSTEIEFRKLGADAMTGSAGQQRVSPDFIGTFWVAVPPLDEQSAIVRFLDHVDRLIRRYLTVKRQLIKLLEEQKHAIIQRAVIRGLDPNVRFKFSGVEWLGEVPEHWEVRRNGRLFAQRNETGFPDLPILEVSLRTGIRVRNLDTTERKQVMSDREKYKRAVAGDIAYNMMRMWQGAVDFVPVDGLVSPAYVVAKPILGVDSRYYANLFRTSVYKYEVNAYSRGIVKDRNRLYWEDFKQMPAPFPPPCEQAQIAEAIECETRSLNTGIGQLQRAIDQIQEYRARLITDAVTGKLDVRAVAAALPEASRDPEELDVADLTVDDSQEAGEIEAEEAA